MRGISIKSDCSQHCIYQQAAADHSTAGKFHCFKHKDTIVSAAKQQHYKERALNEYCYKSVMGLYFGTSVFITTQAIRYATAHTANIMV